MYYKKLGAVLVAALFFHFQALLPVLSQGAPPQASNNNAPRHHHHQMALDLSSQNQSIPLSSHLLKGANTATIVLGGKPQTLTAGQLLTPAELVAVRQVLSGGHQTLVLGALGQAIAGSLTLSSRLQNSLSALIVPANVVVNIPALTGSLNIAGILQTQGTLQGLPGAAGSALNILAQQITVRPGGAITTVLPQTPLLAGTQPRLDLSLVALSDIINAGTIASSGLLTLNAGGKIVNALPSGSQPGLPPVLASALSTNLLSGSGVITNAGKIVANAGNVTFNTVCGKDLIVNNNSGQIIASSGSIYFRDSLFAGSDATTVAGGKISATNINFFGGKGAVSASIESAAGIVNASACTASIRAQAGNLDIGTLTLTGDPNIANSGGDIVLTGDLTFSGEDLAILASGNITADPGVKMIDLSKTGGNGGNLSLVAGYSFTPASAYPQPLEHVDALDADSNTYSLDQTIPSSGSVNLPNVRLKTSSLAAGFCLPPVNGGNVLVAAHNGFIALGDIDTQSANVSGNGGNVSLYAPQGVSVAGDIISTGLKNGGTVDIEIAQPVPVTLIGPVLSFNAGTIQNGTLKPDTITVATGSISVGGSIHTLGGSADGKLLLGINHAPLSFWQDPGATIATGSIILKAPSQPVSISAGTITAGLFSTQTSAQPASIDITASFPTTIPTKPAGLGSLTAETGSISVTAKNGILNVGGAGGATLAAASGINLVAEKGDINVDNATLNTTGHDITVSASKGLSLSSSALKASSGKLNLTAGSGTVADTTLESGDITINTRKGLSLSSSTLKANSGAIKLVACSALSLPPPGQLSLDASALTAAAGIDLVTNYGNIAVTGTTFNSGQDITISNGSALSLGTSTVINADRDILLGTLGAFSDLGGSVYSAGGKLMICAKGHDLDIGSGSVLSATTGLFLLSRPSTDANGWTTGPGGSVTTADNVSLTAAGGPLYLEGDQGVKIGTSNTIWAGQLKCSPDPITGTFGPDAFASPGFIRISSGKSIEVNSSLKSSGGVLALSAQTDITFGSGLNLKAEANGGAVVIFTDGIVKTDGGPGSGVTFISRAAGTQAGFIGGGIEIGIVKLTDAFPVDINNFYAAPPEHFVSPTLNPGPLSGIIDGSDSTYKGSNVTVTANGTDQGLVSWYGAGATNINDSTVSVSKAPVVFSTGYALLGTHPEMISLPSSQFEAWSYGGTGYQSLPELNSPIPISLIHITGANVSQFPAYLNSAAFVIGRNEARFSNFGFVPSLSAPAGSALTPGQSALGGESTSLVSSTILPTDVTHPGKPDMGESNKPGKTYDYQPQFSQTTQTDETIHVSQWQSDLLLFTTANQQVCGTFGGSRNVVLEGEPGTAVSSGQGFVVLHKGHLLADNGPDPLTVAVEGGTVTIPPESTVVFDTRKGTPTRVMVVAGGKSTSVELNSTNGNSQVLALKPGQELIVSDRELSNEDLIPADGVDRVVIEGGVEVHAPRHVARTDFNLGQFARKSVARSANVRLGGSNRVAQQRMISHITSAANLPNPKFQYFSFPQAVRVARRGKSDPVRMLAAVGTQFTQSAPAVIDLKTGAVLLDTSEPTTINSSLCSVHTRSGDIIGFEAVKGLSRVKSLHCDDSIRIVIGGRHVKLPPGQELLIADHTPAAAEQHPADGVGRRGIRLTRLDKKTSLAFSDFSIATMLSSATYLKDLKTHSMSGYGALMDRVMKTAVAVEYATAARGEYNVQQRTLGSPTSSVRTQ